MSVFIPSGYGDRHVDHHALVTFYIRDTLKKFVHETHDLANSFSTAAGATALHVYNANTRQHWLPVGEVGHGTDGALSSANVTSLKEVLNRCGEGSMVVVARSHEGSPACQAREEAVAKTLRDEGLIKNSEQFMVVELGKETKLKNGPLVTRLQLR